MWRGRRGYIRVLCDFHPHADAADKAGGVYKQTVGDTGLEHATESSGGNGHGTQSAAESAALDATEAPLGSDLRAVVSAWPNLPNAIRAGILAMIGAAK